jgi:hypothetical protein
MRMAFVIDIVKETGLIGTYKVTDLSSLGIPGIEVEAVEFYLQDLIEMIGHERNMTGFIFRPNSQAELNFGPLITGILFNNFQHAATFKTSKRSSNPSILRIESWDSALTIEQRKALKYKGIAIADLMKISYANFARDQQRNSSGKKVVPNIVMVEVEMPKVGLQQLQLNYLIMKHNSGTQLINYEKELLIGTMLGMRNNKIDRRILQDFGFNPESARENANICLASLKAKAARSLLTEAELEAMADYEFINLVKALTQVGAEFDKAKAVDKSFTPDTDVAKRIVANALKFRPAILLHGKRQIFWDLPSYLHLVMRHMDTYQVGAFKSKSVLPYELDDLKDLIEKVLGCVKEEIELHFASDNGPFNRSGAMAILFNGDYFIVRINADGCLNQFYIPE